MLSAWHIYTVGILDSVAIGLNVVVILSLIIGVISAAIWENEFIEGSVHGYPFKITKRVLIASLIVLTVAGCSRMLLPSSNLAAAMYILPAAANNEDI